MKPYATMSSCNPTRLRVRYLTTMGLTDAFVNRRKIGMIFLSILWAVTIVVVIDTKLRFTDTVLPEHQRRDCPCKDNPAKQDSAKEEEKVQTKTVVKWLNYCRHEHPLADNQAQPIRSKSKLRSMSKRYINPHPYTFTIKNEDACIKGADSNGIVDALVLVLTAPTDSYSRSLIRETWASFKIVKGRRIVTMFLLGQRDEETQYLMELENHHYRDIIQENFLDSYYNLTLKTIMGLKWASQYCPMARFVMKLDVDMFINVFNLVDRLDTAPTRNFAEGQLKPITKPIRERQSKWYTSKSVYPNATYPRYFTGSSYLMSQDVPTRIYRASVSVPFLPWEDAFVGIVMTKLKVRLNDQIRFEKLLNFKDDRETLRSISEGITFHLGEDKDENKDNMKMVWNRVKMLNNVPVIE